MATVKLRESWRLLGQIGDRSGFGRVFEATNPAGVKAAVKLVPKEPGAARELLFVDVPDVPNIVPVIDSGETGNSYVLVMPLAEKSLRQYLRDAGPALSEEQAVAVLRDIGAALAAMAGRIVHRDLKPENLLLLEGHWCIADFGIARYAEAATSTNTHKYAMTPQYAAPERWRFERSTTATDVYALGVIAHEMLGGNLPFAGPTWEEYRQQHTTQTPPPLRGVSAPLASMVIECLGKAPQARPTADNLVRRLDRVFAPLSPPAAALQDANRQALQKRLESEALAAETQEEARRRADLFRVADATIADISTRLQERIRENAPEVHPDARSTGEWWALQLGEATIAMDPPVESHPNWGGFRPAFDVVADATIAVTIPRTRADFEGRSHSLWFCDAQQAGVYRWFEVGFMFTPIVGRQFLHRPAAMKPDEPAGKALWQGVAEYQVAYRFTTIDQGDEDDFIDRWLAWFAAAAAGTLQPPSSLPEHNAQGSWRRA